MTTAVLKREGLVLCPEHEEADDGQEADSLDPHVDVCKTALKLLELVLDDAAFGRTIVKSESPSLAQ